MPHARQAPRLARNRLRSVTLAEKQQQLVEDFLIIDDPQERLAAIVDRARRLPPLSGTERSEANRVRGCISQAWVTAEVREGRCHFRSDADSPLVRGLVALLCDLYSGASPEEIVAVEPAMLEDLGLSGNLSPTRLNGLRSVLGRIREYASARVASGPE